MRDPNDAAIERRYQRIPEFGNRALPVAVNRVGEPNRVVAVFLGRMTKGKRWPYMGTGNPTRSTCGLKRLRSSSRRRWHCVVSHLQRQARLVRIEMLHLSKRSPNQKPTMLKFGFF